MGSTPISPLFVPSMPGSLSLSMLEEGLPLWEEGRSIGPSRRMLPGFFNVSLALVLIAGCLMTLLIVVILFTLTAAMLPRYAALGGLADAAAP